MNKKGIFFTMIGIILVASLTFFYLNNYKQEYSSKAKVVETRVRTMDSFIKDVEQDIERGLFISSMRSLIGISEHITENGTFLDDFKQDFNEVMLNGTLNGNTLNITKDAHLGTWINKIESMGNNLNVDLVISDIVLTPYQDSPWDVKVLFEAMIDLSDKKGLASWLTPINVTTSINIMDFEDPLYLIKSKGKFTNKIVQTNVTDFVSGTNAKNLIEHANNSFYVWSSIAPNFIMRFSNNLSASPYGIESIVNIDKIKISAPEIYYSSASTVDYIYFGNSSISSCLINETKNNLTWFRLDDGHLALYEAHCTT